MLNYPEELLPKLNYIHIMNIDLLTELQETYVVHRSRNSYENTFNNLDFIREDALELNRIPNMSMNLLGGKFKAEHIKFRLIGNAQFLWDGKTKILLSENINNIEIIDECCSIFINASKVHKYEIPYTRHLDKELFKVLQSKELINSSYKEEMIEIKGETIISHSPNNLNYWHVELKVKDFNGKPLDNLKPTWKKTLCEQVLKDILIMNSYSEILNIKEIPLNFYKK